MEKKHNIKTITQMIKSLTKEDKHWFPDVADYVNNQMGGSAKGWAFEASLFSVSETNCLPVSRSDATCPNADLFFNFYLETVPVQAKAYSITGPSSKIQAATMAKTNFFSKSKNFFSDENNFDGKAYAKFLDNLDIPIDIILTSSQSDKTSRLYCIDFVPLFKKATRIEWSGKKKSSINIYMLDKSGKEKMAFTLGSEKSSNKNCFARGIWMQDWVLEENFKPIVTTKYNDNLELFSLFRIGKSQQNKN